MTKAQATQLRRRITDYTNAAIEQSWKGGGDPADGPEIEQRFKRAETALREFIDALIVKPS